jgi:hypothetical protein
MCHGEFGTQRVLVASDAQRQSCWERERMTAMSSVAWCVEAVKTSDMPQYAPPNLTFEIAVADLRPGRNEAERTSKTL